VDAQAPVMSAVEYEEFEPAPMLLNHDRNAELAVLACCLSSRTARDEAKKHLVRGDFYRPEHEAIWDAMIALDRKGPNFDPAAVMTALHGQPMEMALLPSLLSYPVSEATVGHHARIVRSWGTKRRLYAEAEHTRNVALNPNLDAETTAAEVANRFAAVRDSGITEDVGAITVGELLSMQDDEPDWLIPGLLERRDRLILTGEEGLGKSHMLRQIAIMAASGLDPFDHNKHIKPIRAMVIDCENSEGQVRRRLRGVVAFAKHYGKGDPHMVNLLCSSRIDITRDRDLAKIHYELDACQPEMVVIGPLYRLTNRALQTDDEAAPVLAALDTIRDRGCSLLIEAHAGHSLGKGGHRELRPRGSSALLGWPEFGYGMRAVASGYADLVPWRGDRDQRDWPGRVRHDNQKVRWISTDDRPINGEYQ
jgi:hypothetical protein